MSSGKTEIQALSDKALETPIPLVPDTWQTTAVLGLFLNLVAGLIVAAILLFATTPSRILVATAMVCVIVSALSAVILFKKSKRLDLDNRNLRANLTGCELRYQQRLKNIGIADITDAMEGSEWSPDAVMERAQHQVKFLGVFGHKWVMDSERRNRYRAMLTRIQLNGGKVQFLLLNPNCACASKLALYRNQPNDFYKDFASIEFYKSLAKEFDCFDLRLFDNFPFIRVISVDGVCSISRFKTQKSAEHTLRAPQLGLLRRFQELAGTGKKVVGVIFEVYSPLSHLSLLLREWGVPAIDLPTVDTGDISRKQRPPELLGRKCGCSSCNGISFSSWRLLLRLMAETSSLLPEGESQHRQIWRATRLHFELHP